MGGNKLENKSKTVLLLLKDTRHIRIRHIYLSAEQVTRIVGVLVLLLLCPDIRWHTPQASPRANGVG